MKINKKIPKYELPNISEKLAQPKEASMNELFLEAEVIEISEDQENEEKINPFFLK